MMEVWRRARAWNELIREQNRCGRGREALRLYEAMREEGVLPDSGTFVAALKACGGVSDLEAGRRVHAHLDGGGCGSVADVFLGSALVDMYGKCGSVGEALHVFRALRRPSAVCWTALLMGCANAGMGGLGLELYGCMLREGGLALDPPAFLAALKVCSSLVEEGGGVRPDLLASCLAQGRAIHAEITRRGFESHTPVANSLVDMYAKCGSTDDARLVFDGMTHRTVVSWNAMIMGYAQAGMGGPALQLYARMQSEGFAPDDRTFVAALKACTGLVGQEEGRRGGSELPKASCLEQGRAIHAEAARRGLESNVFVANTLADMYTKCGDKEEARQVLQKMRCWNVASWTSKITGHTQMKRGDLALESYLRMQREGCAPDSHTYVAALKACASLAAEERGGGGDVRPLKSSYLEQGRAIHAEVAGRGLESHIFVANALVDMYAKHGSIEDACRVFEKMKHRNVVSWNTMITGYAQLEMGHSALESYACMQREGFVPDACTFIAVLKACVISAACGEGAGSLSKDRCLERGRVIHAEITRRGFESDVFVASTLVDMYAKCGSVDDACHVFEKMECRNVVTWNVIIMGYVQVGMGVLALELYARMRHEGVAPDSRTYVAVLKACASLAVREEGKGADAWPLKAQCLEGGRAIHREIAEQGLEPDVFIASTLVDLYAKCGSIDDGRRVFERMVCRDIVSWNAMIAGYVHVEMGHAALKLFARMRDEGFAPDAHTYAAALQACGSLASLEAGREVHAQIERAGLESESYVANCIIRMYGKCGSMWSAQLFFDSLHVRNSVAWNALIAGYSGQGDSKFVFDLYARMRQEGIKPDGITFVSILNVCSYNGLVDQGQIYFRAMCSEYSIPPSRNHYTCMIDLVRREGRLDEAAAMVMKMPFEPDMVTWATVLGGR